MSYPSASFVEAPNEDAVVRLDVNAAGVDVDVDTLHDDFSLGMGDLSGAAGSRGRVWGKRQLVLPLRVEGARAAAMEVLRLVAREVTRDGWLRWQFTEDSPVVWFRVYASQPTPVSFDQVFIDSRVDAWISTLTMDADPFGVGEEISLGPFTVTNNPAAGTHPQSVTLPEILGDVPTPAKVRISKTAVGGMLGPTVGIHSSAPAVVTGGNWTPAVDGAVGAAAYVGGSYRQTNAGVTDAAWASLGTFTPATSLPAGRRRTALRLSGSSDAGAFLLRWLVSSPAALSSVATAPVAVSVAQMQRWVDLGVVPFPLADGAALGAAPTTVFTLQAKRVSGVGQLRLDNRLVLLPVTDSTLLVTSPGDVGTAAAQELLDGEARRTAMTSGGNLVRSPGVRGGWPMLRPDGDNVLYLAQNYDPTLVSGRDDAIASTVEVTVTYRPRSFWGLS